MINQRMARRHWPGENVVGQRTEVDDQAANASALTVVGVVGDVRQMGLDAPAPYWIMPASTGADILALEEALNAAERDARALIAGLTEDRGAWRADVGSFDLAGVGFPNPFVPGVRFSLATGLHVIAAHERRHLWQAWRVRQAAATGSTAS
jgi:hypothetical protein